MHIRQITQISESHCGPAVLAMLLDTLGISITQDAIVVAADAVDTLEEHGVTVDQLGKACLSLAPEVQFWYKYHADLDDIRFLLEQGYAVGVEWQGLFYQTEEEEAEEGDDDADYGHYSIISYYDQETEQLIIVDPYKDFTNQDRIFPVSSFLQRWWDTNEISDPMTGRRRIITDQQLLFFVTPKDVFFPREHGFKAFAVVQD